MSQYEDYDTASKHYDKYRQAIGLSVIKRAISVAYKNAGGGDGLVVLDAGCGSGNYLGPLSEIPGVAKVIGMEISEGMLKRAEAKAEISEKISVKQGSVLDPPFEAQFFDVCVVNQVLHHLDGDGSFRNAEAALRALQELLRPGGLLIVNFQDPKQIESCWYYELFKSKMAEYAELRLAPSEWYKATLGSAGFADVSFDIVPEPFFTEGMYLDTDGPEREEWRWSESAWATLSAAETEAALESLREMRSAGKLGPLLEAKERLRRELGLSTSLVACKCSAQQEAHFESREPKRPKIQP